MDAPAVVVDQNGARHELTECLGFGGQGEVYAVKGGRYAVKILRGKGRDQCESIRNRLMQVRRLPLGDLPFAKPLETLRAPNAGYVMELLTGMVPLKSLLPPARYHGSWKEWYLGGGGLRRRLLLLGRTADVLSKLHGKGLVYSDLSPANVFVSKSHDAQEVWFIDTDNLQYSSLPLGGQYGFYTPAYGAPEVVSGRLGVTTLSDAYSFAILAFEVLTLAHPFVGNAVDEGEPELLEQAYAGRLPWVGDPDEDGNRSSFGVPREVVLSTRLVEVFQQTFGPGRGDPTMRPGMGKWAERLFAAADMTLACSGCRATFYFNQPVCPWCEHPRPGFAALGFYLWDPASKAGGGLVIKPQGDEGGPKLVDGGVVSDKQTLVITRRLAFGQSSGPLGEPVVSVRFAGGRVMLRSLNGAAYRLVASDAGRQTEVGDSEKIITLDEHGHAWRLHFGGDDVLHRVMSFELRRGIDARKRR